MAGEVSLDLSDPNAIERARREATKAAWLHELGREEREREAAQEAEEAANRARREEQERAQHESRRVRTQARDRLRQQLDQAAGWVAEAESDIEAATNRMDLDLGAAAAGRLLAAEKIRDRLAGELGVVDRGW